ncbi:MAG TPA: hypothetical protein PLJ99_00520 [Kiritimatiellia bacterium]|nr:hypothetical protein [Kiritimatiellia bacterium]HPR67753.1 hypothetical protein [Kiritimatiellia bacterium]
MPWKIRAFFSTPWKIPPKQERHFSMPWKTAAKGFHTPEKRSKQTGALDAAIE